ncbi:MAG: lysophospholipid acyltransferase family protein [Bdellovibrionota bacterium]
MPTSIPRPTKLVVFVASLLGLGVIFIALSPFKGMKSKRLRLRAFSKWSRWILKIFAIDVSDNRFNHTPHSGPRVIVANHVSYLDIPVLASFGPTVFLAKKEVSTWPLMGWLGRCLGMIFVDRSSLRSRAQAIIDIKKQIRSGISVVIFPEGTTSLSGPLRGLVPFFGGAFRVARDEQVPVEIFYLDYNPLEKCSWLGEESFGGHLWDFLAMKRVRVKVRREWLSKIENRTAQREAYLWSRKWLIEGGHGFMSVMKKGAWSLS